MLSPRGHLQVLGLDTENPVLLRVVHRLANEHVLQGRGIQPLSVIIILEVDLEFIILPVIPGACRKKAFAGFLGRLAHHIGGNPEGRNLRDHPFADIGLIDLTKARYLNRRSSLIHHSEGNLGGRSPDDLCLEGLALGVGEGARLDRSRGQKRHRSHQKKRKFHGQKDCMRILRGIYQILGPARPSLGEP